eukprot:s142_g5.t1
MKLLIDEASKVLKSINEGDIKERRQNVKGPDHKIQGLQRQLDELKATMKPFRISKLSPSTTKGLLDSGATHPLRARRKGERLQHLPKVKVTLAGDKEIYMALTPTGVIVGEEGTEPIVPMGLLTTVLGCEICWKGSGLEVIHPTRGSLDVLVESGCPMVSQSVALGLIEEIEAKAKRAVKALNVERNGEVKWLEKLVAEHPPLQGIPDEIKACLVEARGDRRVMVELDVLHQKKTADLSDQGEAYPLLLRAALNGWVRGSGGGHAEAFEIMGRFLVLYIISETVRRIEGLEVPTTLVLEQPSAPEDKLEVVSWWRTPQWKKLAEAYDLQEQEIKQCEFGAIPTKPTTIGGNVHLHVPLPGRKGVPRDVKGMTRNEILESSKKLSRWPPLLMRSIATVLQTCTMQEDVKFRTMSWQEHVEAGHTPCRKDCRVCQEASARDAQHRRQKLPPKAGILSVDISGPFRAGKDLHGKTARYLLAASFTWPSRDQEQETPEEEVPEVHPEAPVIEDDQVLQLLEEEAAAEDAPDEIAAQPEEVIEEKVEERKDIQVEVTKMCEPLQSRKKEDVLRGIVNMYMRLRADGFVVTQLHSDLGAEFKSKLLQKWCESRTILRTFTPGDQPQMNGRCEVVIQHLKAAIRRTLHGAEAGFERWPIAARFINEKLRQKQIGKERRNPPFLSKVLVRKRFWRSKELEPTQETVSYLCPSWVHHGHWIERADGTQALTKMVMHGLSEAPNLEDWIGIEDALNPIEERRRLRHKASIYKIDAIEGENEDGNAMEVGNFEEQPISEDEAEDWKRKERVQRLVEEEMVEAMSDEEGIAGLVLDSVVKIKEVLGPEKSDEILQTRIVSQAEVRRNLEEWRAPIEKELTSLFDIKGALKKISEGEVKRLLEEERAELVPSKMVFTVKPDPLQKGGKRKARLVACGNFSERDDAQDLFASGASAVALRAALTVAAQEGFLGYTMDVRTAFLNAPMAGSGCGEGCEEPKRAIIRPPALLVAAGLAKQDEFYEAVMALYGFKQSP